jgi:hypothetical protein
VLIPVAPAESADGQELDLSHVASHYNMPHAITRVPALPFPVPWLAFLLFTIATSRTHLRLVPQFPCSSRGS